MGNKYVISVSIVCLLLTVSCGNNVQDGNGIYDVDTSKIEEDNIRSAKSIFYYMYLPSEMYKVFEKAGAVYNPAILNPVESVNKYAISSKAAMNLGVYGVDLSYNKIFGQNQKTLLYFTVIHKLSQQLGVPDNQFAFAIKRIEKNLTDRDSLTKYAVDLYTSTNRYLNENDRQTTAALIIMGGWVEAIYIASSISDDNATNIEIVERIAFQKYSLKSLIALMDSYQKDEVINEYLVMLKDLKKQYDKYEIIYQPGDNNIDSLNKKISTHAVKFDLTEKDIREIKTAVAKIRAKVVF